MSRFMHRMSYSDFDRKMNDGREILVEIEGFGSVIQPYCTAQFVRFLRHWPQASRTLNAQFCESGLRMRRSREEEGSIRFEEKNKKCRKKEE
jgi:hypothetical protein